MTGRSSRGNERSCRRGRRRRIPSPGRGCLCSSTDLRRRRNRSPVPRRPRWRGRGATLAVAVGAALTGATFSVTVRVAVWPGCRKPTAGQKFSRQTVEGAGTGVADRDGEVVGDAVVDRHFVRCVEKPPVVSSVRVPCVRVGRDRVCERITVGVGGVRFPAISPAGPWAVCVECGSVGCGWRTSRPAVAADLTGCRWTPSRPPGTPSLPTGATDRRQDQPVGGGLGRGLDRCCPTARVTAAASRRRGRLSGSSRRPGDDRQRSRLDGRERRHAAELQPSWGGPRAGWTPSAGST